MKPALSPTTTGCLPRRWARALTSSNTSSSVTTVRTTSTNCSTGAGLKKCMPTTRLGLLVATAISVTDRLEVFVARTASGATMPSSLAKTSFLRSRCSGTASTTSWQSREVAHVGGEGDPAVQRGLVLGGELAARDGPVGGVLQVRPAPLDRGVVDLDGDDVDAVAGEHLHDAGTHGAESDHADSAEVTSHAASVSEPVCRGETPRA